MVMDADKQKEMLMSRNKIRGNMFKMDDDPRIIPGIGHFIRRTSLDEFPQFFNVLRGDMSLVGTRPPTVDEYEAYSFSHKKRLAMKPGITGLWQISGRSDITDFEEVVELDGRYIDEWDLEMDVKIILRTILVILKRRGSVQKIAGRGRAAWRHSLWVCRAVRFCLCPGPLNRQRNDMEEMLFYLYCHLVYTWI